MTVSLVSITRKNQRKNGQTQSGTKKQKTQKDTNEVYRNGMKLGVPGIIGLLLLTGCSADTKPEYDPVELIEYEACLNQIISEYEYNEIDKYLEWCQDLRPSKE